MHLKVLTPALFLLATTTLSAQTADQEVAAGDKAYSALDIPGALDHYKKAIEIDPKNYAGLWKAARAAMDYGIPASTAERRNALFASAEQYARRAVAVNPGDANGHFVLAYALGKTALTKSASQRVKYGTAVHDQALTCLRIDPNQAGCLHVMGVWNAEVMRLNGFTRMIARNLLGGKVFGSASWSEAERYMTESVANEPNRIVHHLDLAAIYKDRDNKAKAKTEYQAVLDLPVTDYNDRHYKAEAAAALKSL